MNAPFGSEDAFLAAISRHFPNVHSHMLLGRGDDCAILRCPDTLALTTDLFLEGVHFRREYFSPQDTGYKALLVNVSDIAAMGGVPVGFSLGLAGPPDTPAAYWEGLLEGMGGLAASLDLPLVGGDLNACAQVMLAVTVWGRPGPSGRLLTRGGAQPGDLLFVIGELGLAAVGLAALEQGLGAMPARWPQAVRAHLRPALRVREGLALATTATFGVRGLMDVSDGLARDLPRFLGPLLGAELSLGPVHAEVVRWAEAAGIDPAVLAATGGEDYALLGACAPEIFPALAVVLNNLPAATPALAAHFGPDHGPANGPRPIQAAPESASSRLRVIGRVSASPDILLYGQPLRVQGFDHFQVR